MPKIVIFEDITHHDPIKGKVHYIHNGVEFTVDAANLTHHLVVVDGGDPLDAVGTSCPPGQYGWPICRPGT